VQKEKKRKIFYTNINGFETLTFIYGRIILSHEIALAIGVRKQF
jgi:hypothetical protein